MKNIEPSLISTGIAERTVMGSHPDYDALAGKLFAAISDSKIIVSRSEEIAEVVYGAATDSTDTLRYACGDASQRTV